MGDTFPRSVYCAPCLEQNPATISGTSKTQRGWPLRTGGGRGVAERLKSPTACLGRERSQPFVESEVVLHRSRVKIKQRDLLGCGPIACQPLHHRQGLPITLRRRRRKGKRAK